MNRKCVIINYWWSHLDAHGASLTALALYELVKELEYDPYLLKTIFKCYTEEESEAGRHFQFIKRYAKYTSKNYQVIEDYEELNNEFEHFILGSDQVFRVPWVPDSWFLAGIKKEKNKIAMSASFGIDRIDASEKRINRINDYLKEFSAISLRENDGIDVYNKYFSSREDLEVIIDPVFLIEREFYDKIAQNSNFKNKYTLEKEIILFYVLDMNEEKEKLRNKLLELYDVILIEDSENFIAEDFLYVISKAKLIITDSFHGTCFSIIYNKPFYCIYNELRGTSRINTLRDLFKIDNMLLEEKDLIKQDYIIPRIDYEYINDVIKKEREKGRKWLQNKLENHKGTEG